MAKQKIIGGTAVSSMLVPDWNQTNPNRADFIKNKPEVANALKGYASGNPIVITDVSPVPHELSVQTDIAEAGITKYGKNLFPKASVGTITQNGVTIERRADGSIVLNGTATKGFGYNIGYKVCKGIPIGTKLIISSEGTGTQSWSTYVLNGTVNKSDGTTTSFACANYAEKITIPTNYVDMTVNISIYPGAGEMNNVIFRPMVEVGSTATAYEEYRSPETYTADKNGVVHGIIGNGESMTLIADCAEVTAEYNRDINKAFAALSAAILNS